MPYASSSQLLMPICLKWALVWEQPPDAHPPPPTAATHSGGGGGGGGGGRTLWLGRATPRAWLAEGETIGVTDAPSSYGRVSYTLHSEIDSKHCITANVTVAAATAAHGGRLRSYGAVLRLRTPGHRAIRSVHAGNVALPPSRWNVTDESVSFPGPQLAQLTGPHLLRVCYDAPSTST
jgi:hypothetical protein